MDDRLATAVRRSFRPAARPGRIGAELELFVIGPDVEPTDRELVRLGRPSREPGGQLELSPAPQTSPGALVAVLHRCITHVERAAAAVGAGLELVGTHPSRATVPLAVASPRYLAMQEMFDRLGPDGRRMMRSTASLQICVDLMPGRDGIEQWLVANLAGPALTAMFANSPHLDGTLTARPGNRTAIWRGVDLSRTGYDGRHLDRIDPVGAYLAFAAAAEPLPLRAAQRPDYHLGTLFPPVRPRGGYLEIRYLDTQPRHRIPEAVMAVHTLLSDPRVRRTALGLLLPGIDDQASLWAEAAEGRSSDAADLLAILAEPGRLRRVAS